MLHTTVICLLCILLINLSTGQRVSSRAESRARSSSFLFRPVGTAELPTYLAPDTLVFTGENPEQCAGTTASIQVNYGIDLASIASEQLRNAIIEMLNPDTLLDMSGTDFADEIFNLMFNYSVSYNAQLSSANQGCWAIAYGSSLQKPIDMVSVIREGLLKWEEDDAVKAFDRLVEQSSDFFNRLFGSVGIIVGSGSPGQEFEYSSILGDKRIELLGCIMDQIMQVEAGELSWLRTSLNKCYVSPVIPKQVNLIACRCRTFGDQPRRCSTHGEIEQSICYVADPGRCECGVESQLYPGMKWRFCGESLGEMKKWLNVFDLFNEIEPKSKDGYCGEVNERFD
eukprot:TRINITY_DN709_c0_g1_i3.p1 TRINITY_DN709_c0_g1~~TRINITY_DN709_c0_g1_i3.p1  ORF type:complete len:341 (-),score=34.23 TRINITY_DN709_c0_g1_i3:1665-2687(-)